jgi:hypothetical protein
MAGSYRHITNSDGSFCGIETIENLGDAFEALEECYDMIQHLSGGNKSKIYRAWLHGHLARVCPQNVPEQTEEYFWSED